MGYLSILHLAQGGRGMGESSPRELRRRGGEPHGVGGYRVPGTARQGPTHSSVRLRQVTHARRLAHGAPGIGMMRRLAHGAMGIDAPGIGAPQGRWRRDGRCREEQRTHKAPDISAPGIGAPQCCQRGDELWREEQ